MEPFDAIEEPLLDGSGSGDEEDAECHSREAPPAQVYDEIFGAMIFVIFLFTVITYVVVNHMIFYEDETDDDDIPYSSNSSFRYLSNISAEQVDTPE
ncbi:hypothetical protein GE061_000616 [Apolygus lucorum]|uniref:Uncharacterized protein n=1 Tax=Apolygus lucorum TaxID=248454 RepID=A0A6A4KD61_APOLU|nr:hypothetical protein GE061_000616 [Apolygus lucorum]